MNCFLLSAPYQVLSALEAIHHLHLDDNHLYIVDTGHFTRAQFDSVIEPERWASVSFHDFRYIMPDKDYGAHPPKNLKERLEELWLVFDQAVKRQRANRMARAIGPVDNLVVGNYRRAYDRHMRHLVNRLEFSKLYVLDVGTDTLRINRDRHLDKAGDAGAAVSLPPASVLQLFKRWIRSRLVDWDTRGVDALIFFTTYELDLAPGDATIRNDYAYLKSVVADAHPSDKVLFIGQPLVDQSYLSRADFAGLMGRVKTFFAGHELVYVMHPRESASQLQVIRELGIPIECFTAPFEYAVSFSGERPRGIATFFSSAIENSATIFGDALKLWAFRLPNSLLLKDQDNISKVYAQFAARRTTPIEVVDVLER
ncbi:MAG: hypothetical protein R3F42_14895 [Pseudomonadota bacterium]